MSAAASAVINAPAAVLASHSFQATVSDLAAQYLAANNLLGRIHVLLEIKARTGKQLRLNTSAASGQLPADFDDAAGIFGFESLPFDGAIQRLINLTPMTKLAFDGLRAQYRASSFTVAGVSDVALIDKIQKALIDVLQSGGTEDDFRKAVDQLTSEAGVDRLADAQLHTVFATNFQTAYSNGRFEQMRDPAVTVALPAWKYWTVEDARVRPQHAVLDQFVARYDDPVWRKIYPPSGYNCRCTVTAISADEAPQGWDTPGVPRLPALAAALVPDPGFGGRAWG